MSKAKHLVTVWNPSYASDAMDEQVRAGTETHLYLTNGQLWAQRESELNALLMPARGAAGQGEDEGGVRVAGVGEHQALSRSISAETPFGTQMFSG